VTKLSERDTSLETDVARLRFVARTGHMDARTCEDDVLRIIGMLHELTAERLRCQELARMLDDERRGRRSAEAARDEAQREHVAYLSSMSDNWRAAMAVVHFFDLARMRILADERRALWGAAFEHQNASVDARKERDRARADYRAVAQALVHAEDLRRHWHHYAVEVAHAVGRCYEADYHHEPGELPAVLEEIARLLTVDNERECKARGSDMHRRAQAAESRAAKAERQAEVQRKRADSETHERRELHATLRRICSVGHGYASDLARDVMAALDLSMIIGGPPAAPKPEVTATFAPGWKGGDPCEILMYRPSLGSTEWIPATVVGFEAPKHIVVEVEGREARATANDIRRPPVDDRDARIADLERHAAAARTAVSESAERALATKNMRISELESRESALAETASLLGVLYPERWFNVPEYTRRAIRDRDLGVKSIADLERRLREAEATIAKVRAYCDGTIADAPAFDVARRLVAVDVLAILDGGKS
jgi:hypothetical protein